MNIRNLFKVRMTYDMILLYCTTLATRQLYIYISVVHDCLSVNDNVKCYSHMQVSHCFLPRRLCAENQKRLGLL
jgi:hypothetical protein